MPCCASRPSKTCGSCARCYSGREPGAKVHIIGGPVAEEFHMTRTYVVSGFSRTIIAVAIALLVPITASAQWLNYPQPGVPRLPDGKANLAAPAPRAVDGKPDLSGIWSGAGPMYRFNIAQDLETSDVQPWAESLFLKRVRESRRDSPLAKCMPVSLPYHQFFNLTRIVQTPSLMMVLHESPNSPHRTVFIDGRELPKDPNPTYMGYSVGRWDGDT